MDNLLTSIAYLQLVCGVFGLTGEKCIEMFLTAVCCSVLRLTQP